MVRRSGPRCRRGSAARAPSPHCALAGPRSAPGPRSRDSPRAVRTPRPRQRRRRVTTGKPALKWRLTQRRLTKCWLRRPQCRHRRQLRLLKQGRQRRWTQRPQQQRRPSSQRCRPRCRWRQHPRQAPTQRPEGRARNLRSRRAWRSTKPCRASRRQQQQQLLHRKRRSPLRARQSNSRPRLRIPLRMRQRGRRRRRRNLPPLRQRRRSPGQRTRWTCCDVCRSTVFAT